MFFETLITTDDKSYFVDRLEEITGKPREHWSGLSLTLLRNLLEKAIKENRR